MNTKEKNLLESFLHLIKKNNELAHKCLKDIEKENNVISLEYCLKMIEVISLSLLEYLDDINCYKGEII